MIPGFILPFLAIALSASTQPSSVHFIIDPKFEVKSISPYIYGVNQPLAGPYSNLPYTRLGGNRWTAYNWVNNASNAGNDWHYQSDNFLGGGDTPGGAMIPGIENARAQNASILLTIPINGYVAADKNADGDVRKSGPDYLQTRFRKEFASKGSAFILTPNADEAVYEDEFVNWVKANYPYGQTDPRRAIFFSLDNEPDLWGSTHAEVHPEPTSYAELIQKSLKYAAAVKQVEPGALVFGPANYGWNGYVRLQNAPDAGGRDFQEVYLKAFADAEKKIGHRLLDVLDVHWYPEIRIGKIRITENDASTAVVAARVQTPRSLWDSNYTEESWITRNQTHGPIRLIPGLLGKIARNYPGTKLSISEYQFGGSEDISGAIAQADALGIFGREGVFAANEWPRSDYEPFIAAAFQMFRDFDGLGGTFGDTSIHAETDDFTQTSIYASRHADQPNILTLVAINKSDHPLSASFMLQNALPYKIATVYQLTSQFPAPKFAGKLKIHEQPDFVFLLPAYSVETIRLEK